MSSSELRDFEDADVAVITATPKEFAAARAIFGGVENPALGVEYHIANVEAPDGQKRAVVIQLLSSMGNNSAGIGATRMLRQFPKLRHIIMCGIAGAVPNPSKPEDHVRLGDIVVCNHGGVIQFDNVKESIDSIEVRSPPRPPSAELLRVVHKLASDEYLGIRQCDAAIVQALEMLGENWKRPGPNTDVLRNSSNGRVVVHPEDPSRRRGLPRIFYGMIASANNLLKNPKKRDQLRDKFGVKAIEMEGSGIADATWDLGIGYLVVRGTCDYCNPDKSDTWQRYAAVIAAAYAKTVILALPLTNSPLNSRNARSQYEVPCDLEKDEVSARTVHPADSHTTVAEITVEPATRGIELHIRRSFNQYTDTEQEELLGAIKRLLNVDDDLKITSKRRGSVILRLDLTPEQADRLHRAVQRGELDDWAVDDAWFVDVAKDVDIAKENEGWIKQMERVPAAFDESAEQAAVLFADMVGSAAYKYGRRDIEGISKSYRHNTMAQSVIENAAFGGTVVKFIGDGVMGCFTGKDAATRAVKAGLRLIEVLVAYNKNLPEHDWPKKIDSKIGVHFGPVWMMKFRHSTVSDPQGRTVDFAARLQDTAPPMHISMAVATFHMVNGENLCPPPLHSGPHNYSLKGIKGIQQLYTVTAPCCKNASRPVLPGASPSPNQEIAPLLATARRMWEVGDYAGAANTYRAVVTRDECNFEASYRLAQYGVVYAQDAGGTPVQRAEQYEERLQDAMKRLSVAKAERPYSVALWMLVSYLQFVYCILHKTRGSMEDFKKRLEAAIRDAEHTLALAEGHMDEHGAALARIYLVIYYNAWIFYGLEARDYAQHVQKLLLEAERMLAVKWTVTGQDETLVEADHLDSWMRSNLILGRAMTMINTHNPNRGMIRRLLGQAISACPDNRLAIRMDDFT